MKAFIPAAGFGTRLKPLSDHLPKPLLPVLGKPVIELVIERLISIGINSIGINLHHMHEMMAAWAGESTHRELISLFHEQTILGTGGALKSAGPFLVEDGPFLVHNSDIISGINLDELFRTHKAGDNLVTLAVHDIPYLNFLRLNEKGLLTGLSRKPDKEGPPKRGCRAAFTGIAVYSPEFLSYLPEGASHVVDSWIKAADRGERIGTMDVTGSYWTDIGGIESYAAALWRQMKQQGERCFIHETARGCDQLTLKGMAVVESGARLTGEIQLENAVILPGTVIDGPIRLSNSIAGPGFRLPLDSRSDTTIPPNIRNTGIVETFFGEPLGKVSAFLLHGGGSDRSYLRLRAGDKSAVLLASPSGDPDFGRLMEYTRYFKAMGLAVPELLDSSAEHGAALFEDLGDMSLYNWMKCRRPVEEVEEMYSAVLDGLLRLHLATPGADDTRAPEFRDFGYDYLRWETSYFLGEFAEGYCGILPENRDELVEELHRLALYVNGLPRNIIHRDCQSQNIMIAGNSVPYMIDFQGARIGAAAYDLASLIWDPYVKLAKDLRHRLLEYYVDARLNHDGEKFDSVSLRASIGPCRLQRHMQALGAFAFLSMKRGKGYFEKYIPAGIALLSEALRAQESSYPALCFLLGRIRAGIRGASRQV